MATLISMLHGWVCAWWKRASARTIPVPIWLETNRQEIEAAPPPLTMPQGQ